MHLNVLGRYVDGSSLRLAGQAFQELRQSDV